MWFCFCLDFFVLFRRNCVLLLLLFLLCRVLSIVRVLLCYLHFLSASHSCHSFAPELCFFSFFPQFTFAALSLHSPLTLTFNTHFNPYVHFHLSLHLPPSRVSPPFTPPLPSHLYLHFPPAYVTPHSLHLPSPYVPPPSTLYLHFPFHHLLAYVPPPSSLSLLSPFLFTITPYNQSLQSLVIITP